MDKFRRKVDDEDDSDRDSEADDDMDDDESLGEDSDIGDAEHGSDIEIEGADDKVAKNETSASDVIDTVSNLIRYVRNIRIYTFQTRSH